jgi:hypothetical protein
MKDAVTGMKIYCPNCGSAGIKRKPRVGLTCFLSIITFGIYLFIWMIVEIVRGDKAKTGDTLQCISCWEDWPY